MRFLALSVVAVLLSGGRLMSAPVATTTAATLAQCQKELQPDQPVELRRRATLVAGKYLTVEASRLLAQCLQDEDAVVRRNALVSIGEEQFHLRQNEKGVLGCLLDPEVNIRRLASSLLDEVMVAMTSAQTSEELPNVINSALQDEDAEVRRNVLVALQNRVVSLDGRVLVPFLQESSPETVVLAIMPYLMSDAPPEEQCKTLLPLTARPEREIRLALAEELEFSTEPALMELFQTLAKDEVAEVRSYALACLLRLAPEDDSLFPAVRQLLADDSVADGSRVRLLEALRGFPAEQSWPVLEPLLMRSQPERLRLTAWQILLARKELQESLPTDRLIREFLAEPTPTIRRIQLSILRRRQDVLTLDDLAKLQSGGFADVRRSALSLSAGFSLEQRMELLFNALLDEDDSVRVEAVRLVASLRPPEWKQILCDSLDDHSAAIATAAARGLLPVVGNDGTVADALKKYLPHCQDAALRRQLVERLSKIGTTPHGPKK